MKKSTKIILAIGIPVFAVVLAFSALGIYLHNNTQIFPSVSINGTDISWLTKEEAKQAINLQAYNERGKNAAVSIAFPDGSDLFITGEEAGLTNNAESLIESAYSTGRDKGFFINTINFIQRMFNQQFGNLEHERHTVRYTLNNEAVLHKVNDYAESYNSELSSFEPLICDERVVIVKGAGQVSADPLKLGIMAIDGIFLSLDIGAPVQTTYDLHPRSVDFAELAAIRRTVDVLHEDARYCKDAEGVKEEVLGVRFDFEIAAAMLGKAKSGETIVIDHSIIKPQVSQEYLESVLFRDLIGQTVTHAGGTEGRLTNIRVANAAIDGLVLLPGEEFSFNETVGMRTAEAGFKLAPALANGQFYQALGGGICQVSSSIYSAIRDSHILVLERHPHGRPIAYLPWGRDATVAWGYLDMRFENNTDYPLRISAELDGRRLTVQVHGTIIEESDA